MASDGSATYMECLLKIDTSDGWQKSVTQVLDSFQDLSFEINPSAGFIYVKGKTIPQIILMKLMKVGKHATIHWISYGLSGDDQHQAQDPKSGHSHLKEHDPFYHARDPYETYYQLNLPYYSWYNTDHLAQNAHHHMQHAFEHEPRGHSERRSSGRSHHHHCPVHSHHHHSAVSSQNRHTPVQNSSPPPCSQKAMIKQSTHLHLTNLLLAVYPLKMLLGSFVRHACGYVPKSN